MPADPARGSTIVDVLGEKRGVARDESNEDVATWTCECGLIGELVGVAVCVCGCHPPRLLICGGKEGRGADAEIGRNPTERPHPH